MNACRAKSFISLWGARSRHESANILESHEMKNVALRNLSNSLPGLLPVSKIPDWSQKMKPELIHLNNHASVW